MLPVAVGPLHGFVCHAEPWASSIVRKSLGNVAVYLGSSLRPAILSGQTQRGYRSAEDPYLSAYAQTKTVVPDRPSTLASLTAGKLLQFRQVMRL